MGNATLIIVKADLTGWPAKFRIASLCRFIAGFQRSTGWRAAPRAHFAGT